MASFMQDLLDHATRPPTLWERIRAGILISATLAGMLLVLSLSIVGLWHLLDFFEFCI